MATSDDRAGGGSAFWTGPVGRWALSRKNIVGCVLAVAALALHLAFGLGVLWPLVVLGVYALGAVVTPAERAPLSLAPTGPAAPELRARLDAECGRLAGTAGVPPEALRQLEGMHAALVDVLDRWEALTGAPQQRAVVEAVVTDYLPETVTGFVDIPASMRSTSTGAQGTSADRELVSALGHLRTGAEEIRAAVVAEDLEELRTQGRFLRQRFGHSELDL